MTETLTIKEKLLGDIRGGTTDPDVLGKRWGLNGHDLVKNLEQLRKEGYIHVKMKDDHVQRVRPTESTRMSAISTRSHVEDDGFLDRLAGGINALKWLPNGYREWDRQVVRARTGLTDPQIFAALERLRESGRLLQLGGGGRGVRIQGVRWRGEQPPDALKEQVEAAAAVENGKAPSGPSQAVRDTAAYLRSMGKSPGFPKLTAALERWEKMRTAYRLLNETDHLTMASALAESAEYIVLGTLADELEVLLSARGSTHGTSG